MYKKSLSILLLQLPLWGTSLNDVSDYALRHSTIIQHSKANIEYNRLKHKQVSASKFGEIDLVGNYTHYNHPRTLAPMTPADMATDPQGVATTKDMFTTGITYSVPLFTGFAMTQDIEMANLSLAMAKSKLSLSKEQLVYNVRSLYMSVLSLYELASAQNSHIKALKSLERSVKESVKLGKRASVDLLKVQRDLYDAISILEDIKANTKKTIATLEALSGMEHISKLDRVSIHITKPHYSISKLLSQAMKSNKVKISKYNLKKASKMIQKSQAQYYPTVSLDSYYGYSYGENDPTNPRSGEWADEKNYQVAINAKWKLYDFGKRDASVQQAHISQLQAQLDNKQTLLDLKKSIIQAREDIKKAYAKYVASLKQYKLAKKSLKIENAKYKSGASSIDELLYTKAQTMLSRAKLIQSKYDYQKAKYFMDYVLENGLNKGDKR